MQWDKKTLMGFPGQKGVSGFEPQGKCAAEKSSTEVFYTFSKTCIFNPWKIT
jgi:hypothetical protein